MTEDERQRLFSRIGHIARLYGDAEALMQNGRFPGAAMIAALAYEETGKLIKAVWTDWGVAPANMRNSHDHKQRAVACLIMVGELYPQAAEIVSNGGLDEDDLDRRVLSIQTTENFKSTWWVILGGLEKLKRLSMYWDESNEETGVTSFDIKKHHIEKVLGVLDPALAYLRDPRLLRASAKMWPVAEDTLTTLRGLGLRPGSDVSAFHDGG